MREKSLYSSTTTNTSELVEDRSMIQNFIENGKVNISDFWKKHISDLFSIGDLVSVRMSWYVSWPGQIRDPVIKKIKIKQPKNSSTSHFYVCFMEDFLMLGLKKVIWFLMININKL